MLFVSSPIRAEDLPPPPESSQAPADDFSSSAGAELPPPPTLPEPGTAEDPSLTAEAPPPDATSVETPPGEEIPALPLEGDGDPKDQQTAEVPSDSGLTEVPVVDASTAAPAQFSSSNELRDMKMSDRIKANDLVLWLSLGPSYGTLTGKGSYKNVTTAATGSNDAVGGLGYNAGIGFMLDETFQFAFDFTGTPKTKSSTVDQAMFGFGPRLGFLTLMGVFGVQAGPNPTVATNSVERIFAIGARAGLDLVLKHGTDSRASIGIAPEVYYITPQGADGYNSMGVAVSLRIYGYENAF
jgi:hypothetical protein